MADPREARLPKWVQDELASLRMRISSLERLNDELNGRIERTDTYVLQYGRGKDWPLPNRARVGFHLERGKGVRRLIQCYIEDGRLRVQGDYSFVVNPEASNSLTIEFRERW